MMARLLHISMDDLQEDAADGLAVALCHGLRNSGYTAQILNMKK